MRIGQVVHSDHEWHTVFAQHHEDRTQIVEGDRFESEMNMQDIDFEDVRTQITGVEPTRWPPLTGQRRPWRNRVREKRDDRGIGRGADERMGGRHRRHSNQHQPPSDGTPGRKMGRRCLDECVTGLYPRQCARNLAE